MNTLITKIFIIVIFMITNSASMFSQGIKEYINNDHEYEKILLDGEEAYLNKRNNRVISKTEFMGSLTSTLEEISNVEINMDNWDTLSVNPYKGLKLERPFKVNFDDTEYVYPIDGKRVVTSRFGRRRRGPHKGIDIDLVTGDNVRSILDGKVRFVGYSSGHGRTVVVRHANQIETVYAHLSEYKVKVNDEIQKGEIIGKGGATGNARGSHLHFEIRYKGICIHPEYLMDFSTDHKIRATESWVTNGWVNPLNHSSYRQSPVQVHPTKEIASSAQKSERKIYVVRKGDTLIGIAKKNNMYVRDLLAMNSVSYNSILRIGQHLVVRQ